MVQDEPQSRAASSYNLESHLHPRQEVEDDCAEMSDSRDCVVQQIATRT